MGIVLAEQAVLHFIEVRCYIAKLFGDNLIIFGRMNRNGIAVRGRKIDRVTGCIAVHLEKIATGQQLAFGIGRHHFRNVDSVGIGTQPVGQLIRSPVFTIQ